MKKNVSLFLIFILLFSVSSPGFAQGSLQSDGNEITIESIYASDASEEIASSESESAFLDSFELYSDTDIGSPSLAVTGSLIWWISDGMILCTDLQTDEDVAAFPVAWLYGAKEDAMFVSVPTWDQDQVLLCLCARDESGSIRVERFLLRQEQDEIVPGEPVDMTDDLGFLFDPDREWNEISMFSCGQILCIEALDSDFQIQLYAYDPAEGRLTHLGERSLIFYLAGIPCGDALLVAEPNLDDSALLDLIWLSLADGKELKTDSAAADSSAYDASNFAYDEEENRLYYTLNSTAYTVNPGGSEPPEAIGALSAVPETLRRGAIAGDHFVVFGTDGELLSCDAHGHLTAKKLNISDLSGEEAVTEAARNFGVEHPGYTVSLSGSSLEEKSLEDLLSELSSCDACVVSLNSDLFRTLLAEGKLADLSDSPALMSAVEDMPEYLRSYLMADGKLIAFPVSVTTMCQTLNAGAMRELMGIGPDKIPTDWVGFLKLLNKMASKGVLMKDTDIYIYGMDVSAEEFRATIFSWILQDTFLWLERDNTRVDRLQKVLVPVLDAFNRVDWYGLGLSPDYENEETDDFFSYSSMVDNYIVMDGMPEIAVMDLGEGEEFWPLSIGNNERLVSQTVNVICVSPSSSNPDAALEFLESVWAHTDISTKMTLCQSLDEPVLNEDYEDDLAYMEGLRSEYEENLRAVQDPMEAEILAAELDELNDFLEDYRENAYWLITGESLAAFRAMNDQFVVSTDEVWGMGDEDSPTWQFLIGELSPKQYAKQLAAAFSGS